MTSGKSRVLNLRLVCCFSDLKPQLEDAKRRLDEAKTKQADVMKDLETVQNNLNFTLSTHVSHTHTHTHTPAKLL